MSKRALISLNDRDAYLAEFPRIIYTGMIDKFFDYQYGELGYRSTEV